MSEPTATPMTVGQMLATRLQRLEMEITRIKAMQESLPVAIKDAPLHQVTDAIKLCTSVA
jgi:adenylosuccinate lyase